MTDITYRIWFEPSGETQSPRYVADPTKPNGHEVPLELHQRATAETLLDLYNREHADNQCWRGTFSIVEHVDGRQGA